MYIIAKYIHILYLMNIKFICMSFGKRKNTVGKAFLSCFKASTNIFYISPTLYVYCVYTEMSCMHKNFFYHNQSRFLIFNCAT